MRNLGIIFLVLLLLITGCSDSGNDAIKKTTADNANMLTEEDMEFIDNFIEITKEFNFVMVEYSSGMNKYWDNRSEENKVRLYNEGAKIRSVFFTAQKLKPTEKFSESYEQYFLKSYEKIIESIDLMDHILNYPDPYWGSEGEKMREASGLVEDAKFLRLQGLAEFNDICETHGYENNIFKNME